MKKIFNLLPAFLRVWLIRQKIWIQETPPNLTVKIATQREDLEKAYCLLHDCYVGSHLMAPEKSGLRVNFFSFLPNTTTVIAIIDGHVAGTVSLIKDSSAGLPSDKDFKKENNALRLQGKQLVEVSALAIDPNYRKKAHLISLHLMKYLQHYTTQFMGCTTVTCVIHPRAKDFYAAFWGFTANKKIVKYKFVNDALGVQVFGDITDDVLKPMASLFPKASSKNPIQFLYANSPTLIYPKRAFSNHLDPVFTPALLRYFLFEKTEYYKQLSGDELAIILSPYRVFFNSVKDLAFFQSLGERNRTDRAFRFPTNVPTCLIDDAGKKLSGFIKDLSADGVFFSTTHTTQLNKDCQLCFKIGQQMFFIGAKIMWLNQQNAKYQARGYGIKFDRTQLLIANKLRETHLKYRATG